MFEYHLDVKQARLTICISSWLLDTHFECLHFECILYGREIFMSVFSKNDTCHILEAIVLKYSQSVADEV